MSKVPKINTFPLIQHGKTIEQQLEAWGVESPHLAIILLDGSGNIAHTCNMSPDMMVALLKHVVQSHEDGNVELKPEESEN